MPVSLEACWEMDTLTTLDKPRPRAGLFRFQLHSVREVLRSVPWFAEPG
jgi:hypothetical protein